MVNQVLMAVWGRSKVERCEEEGVSVTELQKILALCRVLTLS